MYSSRLFSSSCSIHSGQLASCEVPGSTQPPKPGVGAVAEARAAAEGKLGVSTPGTTVCRGLALAGIFKGSFVEERK